MKIDTPRPRRLKDYRPPAYLVDHVDLDFALDPERTEVKARLQIRRNPAADTPAGKPLVLDGEQLELGTIAIDGKPLSPAEYALDETSLTIPKVPSRPFSLELQTFINPEANKALQGLYRSRGVFCTQCEAEGFRRITFFPDRPDVLSTYTCRIEADTELAPILLANGNPVDRGKLARGARHFAVWQDPHPKPSYLFALVGGDLGHIASTFKTQSGRKVDLKIYVEHGKEARAEWAMDSLKRSMRWDETRFGREYDLDVFNIVAVSDFNMGAMENKGLNIFNDRLILASPETATDANFESIESVVAHEYFHNWTGNRITCRDWFQLCLKEGLTVYRDQEFSADERSATVQRILDVRLLRAAQFTEDAGPLAHPVRPESYIEINNFYTATVYEKGAELVRMIETILGREDFRRGMDLYFERHDGEAATIEDFLSSFEDASGRDLSHFKLWYSQAGTPELVCSLSYDKAKRKADLKIEQVLPPTPGESKKKPLHIPVRIGLIGANGDEIPLKLDTGETIDDGVLHLTRRAQTFRFDEVPSAPVPSILRGFSAPVNVTMNLSDRDLEFLMAHDRDLFNRWQAANTYATRTLIDMVKSLRKGEKPAARATGFVKALGIAVGLSDHEPAYRAELLKLPSQADIARVIGRNVDPGLIFRAHRQLAKLTGSTIGSLLEDIYKEMKPEKTFSPSAQSAGRRALRNAALTLLTARGTADDEGRLADHFFKAGNMTDEQHALMLLASGSHPLREKALARFYDRWKGDHLVIDTWFAAQAQHTLRPAISHVKALTRHPLFSLTAPNKVRALIGTFAMQNQVQFHRPDGAGYDFVAKQVLAIDRFNPSIAARMLAAFRTWHALETGRRGLARQALQGVARTPNLSRDVFEIVSKMLDQ
ncbi:MULTISPECIES: aminopeptidase N [Hyphomicrobium]|jgi:aminopeptidase N|uniref:aminopeptidase N n=1 Tax=Hyphomicrobium TaxID=81 RepID=UPI0003652B70|nr:MULTISPECIES: aminopeptidase N [Hyphomicrobium]WBT36648.1 aminopeptidase N [Hyphomicrobium sp. DMF-1]